MGFHSGIWRHPMSRDKFKDRSLALLSDIRMTRHLPSLLSLRAFEAAARLGSFTLAAVELGTTQPGISRHIQTLERQIGQTLFVRLNRKIELTRAGRELAEDIILQFNIMARSIDRIRAQSESSLKITAAPSLCASWLVPKLDKFRKSNDGIHVELHQSKDNVNLELEGYDVALRVGEGIWNNLVADKILPLRLTPLCDAGFASSADFSSIETAFKSVRPLNRKDPNWQIWFAAAGYHESTLCKDSELKLTSREMYAHLALSRQGFALLSPDIYSAQIANNTMIQPFNTVIDLHPRAYWLVYPKWTRKNKLITRLRDILTSFIGGTT